jgi:hypothetical protein
MLDVSREMSVEVLKEEWARKLPGDVAFSARRVTESIGEVNSGGVRYLACLSFNAEHHLKHPTLYCHLYTLFFAVH